MKKIIYLADLTHTANGIHASTFPLGTALVFSYSKKVLKEEFEIELFKFPEKLSNKVIEKPPLVLGLSSYSWNLDLNSKLSFWAKQTFPDLIIVWGGPNFPMTGSERRNFLMKRPVIDFFIQNEGEIAFAELITKIQEYDFRIAELKNCREQIMNCTYLGFKEK